MKIIPFPQEELKFGKLYKFKKKIIANIIKSFLFILPAVSVQVVGIAEILLDSSDIRLIIDTYLNKKID